MSKVRCPKCGSDAHYKYGKSSSGKERLICLVCKRQFLVNGARQEPDSRPLCPKCGKAMHIYMRGKQYTRFRCAGYPECRTFVKLRNEELKENGQLCSQCSWKTSYQGSRH